MYNNKGSRLDTIYKLKEQYDEIYEENSEIRESLLVSPYCSKFERQHSPTSSISQKNNEGRLGTEISLLNYVKPYHNQLNKTQSKTKMRRKGTHESENRKKTEADFEQNKLNKQQTTESLVQELKETIRQKDEVIYSLERSLASFSYKKAPRTQDTLNQSPHVQSEWKRVIEGSNSIGKGKTSKISAQKPTEKQNENHLYYEAQILNYKKQIKFLAYNNQQMFEQIRKINEYCTKLKKTFSMTLNYTKQLQEKFMDVNEKMEQFEKMNEKLLSQKKDMMENYQQELKLFRKMKKIWQATTQFGHKKKPENQQFRSKSRQQKHYKDPIIDAVICRCQCNRVREVK